MNKKIVIITGSPRKRGNSMALTNAFVEVVSRKGHSINRFDSAQMNIGGCRACDSCYKTGRACIFDDDFNTIAPAIEVADVVIFSTPVYWYTFPAQIKAVIDKMYSIQAKRDTSGKLSGLISCCADDDISTFEGIIFAYNRSMDLMKWKSIGEVLVPNVSRPDDVQATNGIIQIRKFADSI